MARYRYSGKALATTANANLIEIRAPATGRIRVRMIKIFTEAATALNLSVHKTTAVGTAGTAVTATKNDNADGAATGSVVTAPTGGTNEATAQERAFLPAVIGAAVIYPFEGEDQVVIPLSGSLVVRNDGVVGPAITWEITTEET